MAEELFLQPHLSPTIKKLRSSEFAKIWASASSYLSQQLALHQDVHIPGLGTFVVVRQRIASKKNLVVVERPVFRLANTIVQDHDLQYSHTDIPGHRHVEQLPCAQIASDNAVSERTVQMCIERTIRLFQVCLESRQNVALVWRDVAMVIIQGKEVHTKFYMRFLQRLNGTAKTLQALLQMPEMRDSVISCRDTAASQTSSGHVIVLPWCKLETVPQVPRVKADLRGHVNATPEGRGKGYSSGKKEDLAEKHPLHQTKLAPRRLSAITAKPEQAQKAEGSEPPARQLPATQETILKEEEEKEKVFSGGAVRTVDFIARAIEKSEKDKQLKRKQKVPKHNQKYLPEEKKGKKEPMEEKKRKCQTVPAIKVKPGREKGTLKSQEFSTSERLSVFPLTAWETEESSTNFMEMMMKDWEDAGEEPPTVPEEDPAPPKRSLSPRTQRALREVVTCILRQVARKRSGQRDEQADLQDKLKCELAVLQWQRSGREARSSKLGEDGPRPAPPAWPGKRRAGPARVSGCVEEEEKSKLWDSLRKKYQQKTRAKVAPLKA